jgi:hypothetical protein
MDWALSAHHCVYLRNSLWGERQNISAMFGKLVTQFKQQWDIDALFVADAALYTAVNLAQISQLRWVSRVPATLTAAKQLLQDLDSSAFVASSYQFSKVTGDLVNLNCQYTIISAFRSFLLVLRIGIIAWVQNCSLWKQLCWHSTTMAGN